ncbi:hypothetical protein BDP67DRAFT_495462 [Colletotrichum lupini]|nr:hypothetical protein BDP67DRAFT_495462 [Colletotrichum lupini]
MADIRSWFGSGKVCARSAIVIPAVVLMNFLNKGTAGSKVWVRRVHLGITSREWLRLIASAGIGRCFKVKSRNSTLQYRRELFQALEKICLGFWRVTVNVPNPCFPALSICPTNTLGPCLAARVRRQGVHWGRTILGPDNGSEYPSIDANL